MRKKLIDYVIDHPDVTQFEACLDGFASALQKFGSINKIKKEAGISEKYIRQAHKKH